MIIDNNKEKVHNYISKYTEDGKIDIVTGYFTIGALSFLSKLSNEHIDKYRFVIGDIVSKNDEINAINLLNEELDIDTVTKLKKIAREVVEFLQQNKVETKTLEPNFCHAKLFLKTAKADDRTNYFITGSSNLTEAGIGLKNTSNLELNIAASGNETQFKELSTWFDQLWNCSQAHFKKTIIAENGKKTLVDFKQYLIDEISKIFKNYTPEQIYFKILFELFNKGIENPETEKQLQKIENSVVFSKLFDFQKGAVRSLIEMLNLYNGAILADAVGLGKTWTALAVMKSYQMKGDEIILLCPKKLEQNWKQYLSKQDSIFKTDKFDYTVKFHTDLRDGGMDSTELSEDFFIDDKPKLIVIDESHNLRNDKSSRYQYLVSEILKKSSGNIRVLLLSATPINNSFKDIRNQFKLLTKAENDGFKDSLDVSNLDSTFREVQKSYNEWVKEPNKKLSDFFIKIKESNFFKLTDHLLVARTRAKIKNNFDVNLNFPKHKEVKNLFNTPMKFGDVENFAELMNNLKLNLSAYLPATYLLPEEERFGNKKREGVKVTEDESQREHFLVKMMMILMLKRLESSWSSFKSTIERIYHHHENALEKINLYQEKKENIAFKENINEILDEEDEEELRQIERISFGKKTPISLQMIDKAGNLEAFKKAIKIDKKNLNYILSNVREFEKKFEVETGHHSVDIKLKDLLGLITEKQKSQNKKIIIFTAYKDTASYLYLELQKRGFKHFAMVAGDENRIWNEQHYLKKHDHVLERFAPYTKLYKEKNWPDFTPKSEKEDDRFLEWNEYIKNHKPEVLKKLENRIDILIATDVLSEGQNLQDADCVVNYDIHWNPVRVIQRVGRVDRIGSPNAEIQCVNFWPAKAIDDYIQLKSRVETRMAIMKMSGSEVIDGFTDDFNELAHSQSLEDQQNAAMLKQMGKSMEEIDGEKSLGLDDLSFDNFRQQLFEKSKERYNEFKNMPNGIFSGFSTASANEEGIIALLGYPSNKKFNPSAQYLSYELIHIDFDGNQISANQKVILDYLSNNYRNERFVPKSLDEGDPEFINKLSQALKKWILQQAKAEVEMEDGTKKEVMSTAQLSFIDKIRKNPKEAKRIIETEGTVSQKYNTDNFDLITWLIIVKE
jgi:superfamily II DNA or RNA helicase